MSAQTTTELPKFFVLQLVVRLLLFFGFAGALLFGIAGTWRLWAVWAYMGILLLGFLLGTAVVLKTDPTLLRERMKPGPGGKDPYLRAWGITAFLLHWTIAGLDIGRFHWSDQLPVAVQVAGLAGLATSMCLSSWAISVNRFFSSDARIQRDRGHHLITGGPYQWVRHPGYASAMLMSLSGPLALGSLLSGIPVLAFIPFLFRRLFREEKLLVAELEGYADYAGRVRSRLIPGVW